MGTKEEEIIRRFAQVKGLPLLIDGKPEQL
jgi:hypothetical protein